MKDAEWHLEEGRAKYRANCVDGKVFPQNENTFPLCPKYVSNPITGLLANDLKSIA